jgi:DNA-binding Xre family transcriptional regulator
MSIASFMKSERGHEVAATEESALILKAAELRRGRSLSEVAQIVGIRPEELSKIEAGKTKQIRWVTLLGLTRAYDCSLGDLLEVRTKENDEFPERAAFLAAAKARTHKPTIRRLVRREEISAGLSTAALSALSAPVPAREVRRVISRSTKNGTTKG